MRAAEQYFTMIQFIKLYKVALIFKCDHSNAYEIFKMANQLKATE